MLYKISHIGYDILFTKEDISFIQSNKISHLVYQISYLVYKISILIYKISYLTNKISDMVN